MASDSPYTPAEQAHIAKFAADDEPPSSSAPKVALVNMVTSTTRQKSAYVAFRVRAVGDDPDDLHAVVNKYKDDFDMYMIELYKWFPVPANFASDMEILMANAIEKRIRDNIEKERDYEERKKKTIEEMKSQDVAEGGAPTPAAKLDLSDIPEPKKASIDIPKNANIIRFKDLEPSTKKDKYVVFSFLEIEKGCSADIPGVEAIVKIHGIYDDEESAKDRSDTMHKMMRHKHLETCIGVMDAWLTIPPPKDIQPTYDNKEHNDIYDGRWSEKQKKEVQAVYAYHEHKEIEGADLEKELVDKSIGDRGLANAPAAAD